MGEKNKLFLLSVTAAHHIAFYYKLSSVRMQVCMRFELYQILPNSMTKKKSAVATHTTETA